MFLKTLSEFAHPYSNISFRSCTPHEGLPSQVILLHYFGVQQWVVTSLVLGNLILKWCHKYSWVSHFVKITKIRWNLKKIYKKGESGAYVFLHLYQFPAINFISRFLKSMFWKNLPRLWAFPTLKALILFHIWPRKAIWNKKLNSI